ncbi:MAG: S41 family peptidase [Gemmatimonadetes bacterium]|nr:MAG: S41 family peptidase [Gemmatimonadota bacterium]
MKNNRTILAPIAVFALALVTGGWFLQRGVEAERSVFADARLFREVVDHVRRAFVDEVDQGVLYRSAIDGALESLGDPHTNLIDAETWDSFRFRSGADAEYGGVGLEILRREGEITVMTAMPGGPAKRVGIRPGDVIVEVDGVPTEDWDTDMAAEHLRGSPGTSVRVKVRRPGVPEPIEFTIERAVIELKSVPFARMLEDGIGYVPLQVFNQTSSREVEAAIADLRAAGMRALVLDLRQNPGGLLDEGAGVADLFLDRGELIVETRGRVPDQNQTFSALRDQVAPGLPVVVLVDEGSASASEILAGALQDHDRALVVGERSFGKGSVQTLYRLSGGNVLRLTTARWYTPAGRTIQKPFDELDAPGGPDRTAIGIFGEPVLRPDPEADAERPTFRSMGGRTLVGGGGITPDLIVLPDTLTSEEQDAVWALNPHAGVLATHLFDYAVRYVNDHAVSEGFRLPEADLDAFYRELADAGVTLEPDVRRASRRFMRARLEREILTQALGEEGAFAAESGLDGQLRAALEVLRRAETQADLFEAVQGAGAGGGGR